MSELLYKSKWCKYVPIVYENNSVKELKGNVIFKNGKYIYSPSEEYYEFSKRIKKIV